jgi:NAD(P)-dependent dehydrogenase (short-subunit alcohol dehydrogenase family)
MCAGRQARKNPTCREPRRGLQVSHAGRSTASEDHIDLQLGAKRALITGSTGGIGFAIARTLAREGAAVVVNGRTSSRVEAACARIRRDALGSTSATGVVADLSSAEGANEVAARVADVDILVNNVGAFEPKPFAQICDADWMRLFELNVMSGVRLARHYLPRMTGRGWGRIIFISSESAINIPSDMIHYGMTKTAQLAISRGLAETTAGTGVTVNAVLPGPTRSEGAVDFIARVATEQGTSADKVERQFFDVARPTSLLRRFIEPGEVAAIVAYLCSPLAAAVNGAATRVDGGVVRAVV